MSAVDLTPRQWDALADWLSETDTEDGDRIRLTAHAGGDVRLAVIDRHGIEIADVEVDPSGEA